jgi:hypothetical protein
MRSARGTRSVGVLPMTPMTDGPKAVRRSTMMSAAVRARTSKAAFPVSLSKIATATAGRGLAMRAQPVQPMATTTNSVSRATGTHERRSKLPRGLAGSTGGSGPAGSAASGGWVEDAAGTCCTGAMKRNPRFGSVSMNRGLSAVSLKAVRT